jgi:iron complex outermembrane receptor protein
MNLLKAIQLSASAWVLGVALSGQVAMAQEVKRPGSVGSSAATTEAPVTAQPASGGEAASDAQGLGEIVVTARRTNENLQSVPIAITAFSGAQLQQQNARTLSDVALLTPGLRMNYSTATPSGLIVTIRGQAVQDPLANQDPAVGVYVDGLYWARAYGASADLLDIQGVQVLKGPQGTLFGRNTTGGAILLNTNDPNFDGLSGLVSASYGRFDYRMVSGVINAPLIEDKLAVRVAGQLIKRDGYIHDINNGVTLGNLNSYTVRSKLLFKPTENLSIIVSGEWYRSKTLNEPTRLIYASPTSPSAISAVVETDGSAAAAALGCFSPGVGPACQARASALFNDSIAKNQGDNADLSTIPRSYVKTQTYGATATLDTFFGSIKAIGGYRKVRSLSFNDNDGSRFSLLDEGPGLGLPGITNDDANLSQYSVELVATGKAFDNRLEFAAGLYNFHESGYDGSSSMSLAAISTVVRVFYGNIKNDSKSIFGQGTYHVTDALSLTGGLRYSVDDKRLTSYNYAFPLPGPPTPANTTCTVAPVCPASRHDSFTGVSYTASIDYRLADGVLAYVKTAKGYRAGGENMRMSTPAAFIPFKPEDAFSYEGGVKSEFFEHRLRVNVAGYYTTLKDIQRTINVVSASGVPAQAITNAGQADFYGGEFEASAALPAGFRLDGSVGYTHPKYVKFIDNGFDRSRDVFYGVPKWTASISPSWTHDFDVGKLLLRADFSYQSDMNISTVAFYTDAAGVLRNAQNGNPVSAVDAAGYLRGATDQAHWLINARAGITMMDGKLELAVWGRNLTNKRDYVAGLTLPGLGFSSASEREPRTFGITASMKFGAH